ncbi:hypothetical protein PBY51_020027 [Eleginops maclovinus]|uniref:Uncharacterized protein n=1 Tax=Eleginops maclovinus TaxID=56733 RepID=A0AAN7XS67_ELEMC|nr:hypothetical protein PBY51_020027 [Eleginops maclovinus]
MSTFFLFFPVKLPDKPKHPCLHKPVRVPGKLAQPRQQGTLCLRASLPEKLISLRIQASFRASFTTRIICLTQTPVGSADLEYSSRLVSAHQLSAVTKTETWGQNEWTQQKPASWRKKTWMWKVMRFSRKNPVRSI